MAKKDTFRICLQEEGVDYKVTSIYLSNDGSFKIDVPYCNIKQDGLIVKVPITSADEEKIPYDKMIKVVLNSNRPQLSIHASGFVHFSGPGITSGIDPETGKSKGMGLRSLNR